MYLASRVHAQPAMFMLPTFLYTWPAVCITPV